MNTKTGKKLFAATGVLVAFYVFRKFNRELSISESTPNINQYLNRLIEFFNIEELPSIKDEFLRLIEFGLNPSDAFEIISSN